MGKRLLACLLSFSRLTPNCKHWFTASFLWRKVLESGARSVGLFLCVDALCCGNGAPRCTELGRRRSTTVGVVSAYSRQMHDE